MLNWHNERISIKFSFFILKVESPPPLQPIWQIPPYVVPLKMKKKSKPPQKLFENQKSPPPHSLGEGGAH